MVVAQDQSTRLAVGLCTFKRPAALIRLLDHIAIAARPLARPPHVIVVDNDGSDPAVGASVEAFSQRSGLPVVYRVEKRPGISAARNAVFDEAYKQEAQLLAMIDDDEWPTPEWITEMLKVKDAEQAIVVGGPVKPVFPENSDDLLAHARFWSVGPQQLEGKPFVFCTCNFLIDLEAIAAEPRPLFDEEFGLSGGGDTVFFRKLFFRGHKMAWADNAMVLEEVPKSRASLSWMRSRRYRVGNHAVRWEVMDNGKVKPFLKSIALAGRLLFYPILGREPETPWLGWLFEAEKVRGRFAGHFGSVFMEYARPAADKAAASAPKKDGSTCR